jgi:hypothetical protein
MNLRTCLPIGDLFFPPWDDFRERDIFRNETLNLFPIVSQKGVSVVRPVQQSIA